MRPTTMDFDALRSFVVGVELGSFTRAADRLGRSTSAVSAQLKKLEQQAGVSLMRKAGRGLVLTPGGELLLAYARRMLTLNDEAILALRGAELSGTVRIGLQEDFGETLLPRMLGEFSRAHPLVSVEAHVVRNAELQRMMESGRLDLALAWDTGANWPHMERLGTRPLCWIAPRGAATMEERDAPLQLVLFEAPCVMRSAAIQALDQAGIPWRVVLTSISPGGIWAGVGSGLGVTVRTTIGLPAQLQVCAGLPALPQLGLVLWRSQAKQSPTIQRLAAIVQDAVRELVPDAARP